MTKDTNEEEVISDNTYSILDSDNKLVGITKVYFYNPFNGTTLIEYSNNDCLTKSSMNNELSFVKCHSRYLDNEEDTLSKMKRVSISYRTSYDGTQYHNMKTDIIADSLETAIKIFLNTIQVNFVTSKFLDIVSVTKVKEYSFDIKNIDSVIGTEVVERLVAQ